MEIKNILKTSFKFIVPLLFVFVLVSCGTTTTDETEETESELYTTAVDSNDDLVSETIYASPDVDIEYDFDKEDNDEAQDDPTAAGTYDDPYDVYTALHTAGAGDTVILLPGTYTTDYRFLLSQSGNAARWINVEPYDDDTESVIFDFSNMEVLSTNRGIQLTGDYWHFYGIDVKGAGDNGMYVAGNYNEIESCRFYNNQDTGLQLGRAGSSYTDIEDWPCNNLILNCSSFNNYDVETLGENADGFAAKLTVGEGNIFDGCIAYRNADDGWDMYAKTDTGNVGAVTIINCVAFENGWVLDKVTSNTLDDDGNYIDSYMTQNGDGNGFKLGGSSMNGDVTVKNCLSFNNRMAGFADNSNPGTLSLYNCTAYNNSVYMSMTDSDGAIDTTGDTGAFGANDGDSCNFSLARTESSYNTFYGCLSYCSNMTDADIDYDNFDAYRGATSYCVFLSGIDTYMQVNSAIDAYSDDSDACGTSYDAGVTDDNFKTVDLGITINGNYDVDSSVRNSDGSINMGDFMELNDDDTLATFADGDTIGAVLDLDSYDSYEHPDYTIYEGDTTVTSDEAEVQAAIDALSIACDSDNVFQDVDLLTEVNGLEVSWYSSDENLLSVGYDEETSESGRTYVIGSITRPRDEDTTVTLTATIALNDTVLTKTFTLTIMAEDAAIGDVTGYDSSYIVSQYDTWNDPTVTVTDANSDSDAALVEGDDYTIEFTYEYAESTASTYYDVDGVYTSVAGVYKVSFTVTSLLGDDDEITGSYLVYVLSETADIDMSSDSDLADEYDITQTDGYDYMVNASRDGALVTAAFTNTYGYMYLYTSTESSVTASEVIANGTKISIEDEYATGTVDNENTAGYYVYIVITNRTTVESKQIISDVYSSYISCEDISTTDEFYDICTGSTSSTTIYLLTCDLDFTDTDYDWTSSTTSFSGLVNGQGYTISNIDIEYSSTSKTANIFYKLKNGTIMNINFDTITINSTNGSDSDTGIVGAMAGGYIDNVCLTNVAVSGNTGVAALVGHVSSGVNYITDVALVNPQESGWICGTKYVGGLVGNMQKDSSASLVELYVENCYVNAYVGDHNDSGYIGGIVGRDKNEYSTYVLSVTYCYFTGTVDTGYTYSGGIIGSADNASGYVTIQNNVSDCLLVIKDTTLDKDTTTIGQKNNSPIIGRFTYETSLCTCSGNYGPYDDYHSDVNSNSDDFYNLIANESFWFTTLGYDDTIWTFTSDSPYCVLTNTIDD